MSNLRTYFRIVRFVRPYWKQVMISVICTVLYSVLSGASISLFIPLLDILFHPESAGAPAAVTGVPGTLVSLFTQIKIWFLGYVFSGTQMDALFRICTMLILTFVAKNFFGYMQTFWMNYAEEGVIKDLRNAVYRHLHDLPLGYFTNERTGELISRITNDVTVVNGGISAFFVTSIREPLLILVFLSMAISISWQLTLISFTVFPFALFIISAIAIRLHKERSLSQERLADITSVLQETISGVKVVKAFGMEKFEMKKFMAQTQRYFASVIKITRIRDLASPTTEILSVMAGAVIIWFGGRQILIEHRLQASEFLFFLFIIFQIMPPIKELTNVNNRIQEASAAGKRLFEILDTEPGVKNPVPAPPLAEFSSGIEYRNVHFSYPTGDEVLSGVSMTIRKGEVVAIVGPSGSGKTTLVDLLPRFYDPLRGGIYVDGTDIRSVDIHSLREKIGIVTQEVILFNDTVRNNIAYGLEDATDEEISAAARAANAHAFIMEMPQTYRSVIGERGVKLSGGERQRLSLARAILKNPPILILDEATSALDTESELLVQGAINNLMSGRTSIVIAHRLSTIQHADRIVVLSNGRIVETGRHTELLENSGGLYRKLYELQFRV
ncbi:MAG TPA: ABC transporter ATP-binding protein [Bacteroidota bacterium]|nr:ABC transporter ATP-binding protein [Bacteroidota bacterium]